MKYVGLFITIVSAFYFITLTVDWVERQRDRFFRLFNGTKWLRK